MKDVWNVLKNVLTEFTKDNGISFIKNIVNTKNSRGARILSIVAGVIRSTLETIAKTIVGFISGIKAGAVAKALVESMNASISPSNCRNTNSFSTLY